MDFSESHDGLIIKGNHYKSSDLLSSIEKGDLDVAIIPDSQIVSSGDYEFAPFAKEDLHLFISGEIKNKKKLVIGNDKLNELTKVRSQLTTSYGVWTDEEWEEVSSRMSISQQYKPAHFFELPNFRSVIISLQYMPSIAVCDIRFGYPVSESVYHTPLTTEGWLCCVWHKQNENRLIHSFKEHMVNYYGEHV